jgi:putative transposase
VKKGQYSDEQIVAILQEAEKGDKTIQALCREHNLSENTFYRWRSRFGGATPIDIAKNREIEKENARLKRLLAERDLEVDILKELLAKK